MRPIFFRPVGLSFIGMAVVALATLITAPSLAAGIEALFAPKANLWQRWTAHDPAGTARIDHGDWEHLLRTYVTRDNRGVNRVAYGRFSAAHRGSLEAYVQRLARTPISAYNRDEQQAFWINLYNALTVKVVLDHDRVESIRDIDISPGLFSDGPWGRKLVTVEDEAVSLDDIEHRILRPIWRDARIHYALNCAAVGCPNLQATAYTGENAEGLLDRAAREYVNNWRGARVEDGGLTVSSLYVWYQGDFGGGEEGVIAHLRRYAEPPLAARLKGIAGIDDDAYDWALNEAAPGVLSER